MKVDVIRNNRHKYSVPANLFLHRVIAGSMYIVLQLARSTYYYKVEIRDAQDEELAKLIATFFKKFEITTSTKDQNGA